MSVGDIVEALLHGDPDGISISGGEPTEQMDDLLRLAMVLWPMFQSKKGLLLFSGTSPEQREALPLWGALQRNLDAAILGPYKEELAIRRPTDMRSSSNQRIEVYGKAITAEELHGLPQIEVIIAKSGRTMLGFPNREDIKCLQS